MLTGRDGELARLAIALADHAPVVVVGPAGVGKSTLCRTALTAAGDWHETGALATLRWSPLLLFRRLLGDAVRDAPDRVAAQVLRLAPGGLLLDDLQWADDLSFDATSQLVGRLPLLATVRSGDPGAEGAEKWLVDAGFERLDLAPLGPAASRTVLDAAHPGLAPALRDQVMAQAGGNPLLLTELAGQRRASPTLVRALQSRLADHPADVRVAMLRLSVLGRPTEPEILGSGGEALVSAGLATMRDGLVDVHHALLAEAVVEELGVGIDDVRRELADLVEADEGAFLLARAGDRDQARRLALAAAASAESKLVEAELLVLAVSCAPPGDLDAENRMAAARTLTEVGLADRAFELCSVDGVEALPPVERGAVRAVAAEAAWLAGRPTEFAELISAAVEDLRGTGTAMEVQALAGSTLTQTRIGLDGRPALERAHEAVALADKLGLQQGFARYRLASVLLTSGQPGWSDLYRDVIAGAEKEHDHRLRLAALESLVLGEWIAGDIDDAVAVAEGFYAEGPPPGMEASWLSFVAYGSLLSVLAGRDRAAVIDRLMSLLRDEALFRNRPYAEAALAIAFADLGRHDEAAEVLYRSAARPGEDAQLTSVRGWAFTETAWLAGRAADALEAGRGVERLGVGDYPSAVNSRLIAAYACRDLGEPVRGSEPAAAVPSWAAAPHEWRGLVAAADDRHDDAVEHFDLASAAWASHDRRSEVRAAWAAGESARLVRRDDAATRLTEAEQMALRVEQTAVAARARHSLRALGVIRGSARGAGVSGLTAREEEVLLRVGAGLTSAEIAAELHVSMSTVNSLIRSAVRRLGASNRRTAAVQVLRDRREHLGGT